MVKMKFATLARIAPVLALFSCVTPKANIIAPPEPKQEVVAEATVPEIPAAAAPDDGMRLPDMFELPGDGEFRATVPTIPQTAADANAVISRPPTDPPSRPKPKEGE